MSNYKLGLKPVLAQPRLRLADYLVKSDLPDISSLKFPIGHAEAIRPQMFMNDTLGDCAIAGSIEEVRLANALRGVTVPFTDETAVENYSAITRYVPGDPSTDQGTDVHDLYDYRKTTGLVDADGNRHKVLGYAGLTVGDFDQLLVALSMFDMVGIGIRVPSYCESQFEAGEPWHLVTGRYTIEGQHYIPVVGATDRNTAQLYTWGATGGIDAPFYNANNVVAVVALTAELFDADKSPEGLNMEKLSAALPEFNTGPVMARAPRTKRQKAVTAEEGTAA
jgi:hypothetical protein